MPFEKPSFVTLSGARIAFRDSGRGRPLLLVHGYPLSSLTWRKVVPQLEASHRCIAVDLMGAGDTEVPSEADLSIAGQSKMLAAFIDELGLPTVTLIAHDSGAVIARLLAVERPERIRQFVLSDTEVAGHVVPSVARLQRIARLPGMLRLIEALGPSRRLVLSMMGNPFYDRSVIDVDEFLSTVRKPLLRSKRLLRASLRYAAIHDLRFVDTIPHEQLTMPKLVLWGEHAVPLLLSWGRELYDALPEPKSFVVIANCGILPHEERPADWLTAVSGFLEP